MSKVLKTEATLIESEGFEIRCRRADPGQLSRSQDLEVFKKLEISF